MKMSRTILRRLEMKIHHAMTLDQDRKLHENEPEPKPETAQSAPEAEAAAMAKLQDGI
jgi:hypothetical protein